MNSWERCNKVSGAHWPRVPLHKLSIKILLRPIDGTVPLPKFEDYINASDATKLQRLETKTEEYTFKWQEKVFSAWELQEYEDIHNCTTEQQCKYHEAIKNREGHEMNKLFTYVKDDNYETEALTTSRSALNRVSSMGGLGVCFERLKLAEEVGQGLLEEPSLKNLGKKSLCRREAESEEWTAMHIMMDDSEQAGEIELVLKREVLLVSLLWNASSGCLVVRPDVNDLEGAPYVAESGGRQYHYAVQLCPEEPERSAVEARGQLMQMVTRLRRKWERRHRHLAHFACPPPAARRHHVTLQILSAVGFEDDNIYVEFEVRMPPGFECEEKVEGRTHTASTRSTGEGPVANYSHLVEFQLDCEDDGTGDAIGPEPRLFVEVISVDRWERERTQGAAQCSLRVRGGGAGGARAARLECARPAARGGEARRFFLGGARLLDDVGWLAVPADHQGDTLNKFGIECVASGAVDVRVSVVSHARRSGDQWGDQSVDQSGDRSAGALLRSVGAVLREYKRARERLAACKGDIQLAGPSFLDA